MDITTFIPAFREAFPEFADEQTYPDAMVTFWFTFGEARLNTVRWGDLLVYGLYLYVAHNITLAAQDLARGARGKSPGLTAGVLQSKGVGDVSVGYDVNSALIENAGNYNMTKYGREFWQMARIIGMGGAQT